MIANITTGSFLKPFMDYNQRKVKEGVASTLLVDNVYNQSENTAQSILLAMAGQSKRKDKFLHVSLNFPSEDKAVLSDQYMKDIAKDYIKEIGFPKDHPIIVYRHSDTQHPHMHIVTSKILETGKPLPDSNYFYKSQRVTRELEDKYQLTKVSSKKSKTRKVGEGSSLKNDVIKAVDNINKTFHPNSLTELNQYLNSVQLGLTVLHKEKEHRKNSDVYNLVYHRVGDNGQRLDKGIKSSAFGTELQHSGLECKLKLQETNKEERNNTKRNVSLILSRFKRLNIEEFKSHLIKKGIELHYKYDSKKNLVGISYTNSRTGNKYTGEQLGVKLKSTALREILTQGTTVPGAKELTRSTLQPMRKKLSKMDIGPSVQQLLAMGYHIHEENKQLLVSDYRNNRGEGYIPIRKLDRPINHNIVKLYTASNKNYFSNNLEGKIFLSNREQFIKNFSVPKQKEESQYLNRSENTDGSASLIHTSTTGHDDHIPQERIADIDKKKKKRKGKKI